MKLAVCAFFSVFMPQNYAKNAPFPKNAIFFEKNCRKICTVSKMSLTLHRKRKKDGSLAQLNRASDYGSEGY
ncbi:hypothetical protein, partial [Duncaniella freteri]|uniref:hypothetical protein n=3 Tax=Duncaniella TaxID=2518495 RepID=UPI00256EAE66